ncbi:P-loop containing nucleoside triphosphate hydrolase protein [Salix suchowensis]|nr:P-loop containing nucleoside triphosphate hydrolase protein [Salix suchowensis]
MADNHILVAYVPPACYISSGSALKSGQLVVLHADTQVSKPFQLDGRQISLIDTPGFDDTTKSDFDVLNAIAFLSAVIQARYKARRNNLPASHLDIRMGGISTRCFRMFRELCGETTFKNIVIVTNMWGQVSQTVGNAREAELASDTLFFKPVLDKGAQLLRHDNTADGARNILRRIIKNHPLPLLVQTDLVDRRLDLSGTSAANALDCAVNKQKEKHRIELTRVRQAKDEGQEKPRVVAQGTSQLRADLARLRADLANKQSAFGASSAALQQQVRDQFSAFQVATKQLASGHEGNLQSLSQHLENVRREQEREKAVLINRLNQLRS